MKKIECVIMDWAGTAVDYGCFAPVAAFLKAFAEMCIRDRAYSKIPAYDWYKPHQDIFRSENTQTMQTTKTCMALID